MTNGSSDRLDRIEHLVEKNAEAISQLTARMNQASIDAEADRRVILAAMEQHDVTIARIDRILDYLFGQQRGNRHGNESQQ